MNKPVKAFVVAIASVAAMTAAQGVASAADPTVRDTIEAQDPYTGGGDAEAEARCSSPAVTNNSSAYGEMNVTANLKTAPAARCSNVRSMSVGTGFYVWCYVYNQYGNPWVYGRVKGTQTKGWMSGDNLWDLGGTLKHC